MSDGIDVITSVTNGKLIFRGFYLGNTFNVTCQNLTFAGTINGRDQIAVTTNANVSVDKNSFPYPVNGSSEYGTIIFNGHQYNYSVNYNGSNQADVAISGEESLTAKVNMATGAIVETKQETPSDIYETGIASWYGALYDGKTTASGEIFDKNSLTAAHRTLPFGTLVSVTNAENGRVVTVKINDRGPFNASRIIDVSEKAADELGMKTAGLAQVTLKLVGTAPIDTKSADAGSNPYPANPDDSDTNPYDTFSP